MAIIQAEFESYVAAAYTEAETMPSSIRQQLRAAFFAGATTALAAESTKEVINELVAYVNEIQSSTAQVN